MNKCGKYGPMTGRLLLMKMKEGKDNNSCPCHSLRQLQCTSYLPGNTEIWLNFLVSCINKPLKADAKK